MTSVEDRDDAQASAYRSRWRRFSPSMGWKAFWSEILIVVLGVVIALAASEAVEDWNWRNKVADGHARLQVDVDTLFQRAAEQYATTPCVEAQLESLTRNLIESGSALKPPLVQSDAISSRYILRMPTRVWRFSVWEALVANGTATHFTKDWQGVYALLSDSAMLMESTTNATRDLQMRLMAMAYPIDLDPQVRREFLVDLEGLRMRISHLGLYSSQLMDFITEDGIAPDSAWVDESLESSWTVIFCKEHNLPLADWRKAKPAPPRR